MMHWIVLPVVLPALLAPLIGSVMRHDMPLARTASVTGTALLLAIAIGLVGLAADGTTHVYRLGDWPAPFGIVLVLDRLSALMVLHTSVLALIVLIHAIATGWDSRGRHFHALFQFQLMGICGAFLTGDVFTLFDKDVSQTGYGDFTGDDNADNPAGHPTMGHQHDECGRNQQFIGNGIHDFTEIGNQPSSSCIKTVQPVGDCTGAENYGG